MNAINDTTGAPAPIAFNGVYFNVIERDGQKWLTAEQIGLALGYDKANAGQGIRNLYNRHASEFTETDTCQIKMIWQGQNREMRIFSSSGCILLTFFSSTPRAAQFRAWAKKHLAGQMQEVAPTASEISHSTLAVKTEVALQQMAAGMKHLANGINAVLEQNRYTGRYISLLELNQQGKVRITPQLREEIKTLAADGMDFSSIARLCRVSRTSVSLIARGLYPETRIENANPAQIGAIIEAKLAEARQEALPRLLPEGSVA